MRKTRVAAVCVSGVLILIVGFSLWYYYSGFGTRTKEKAAKAAFAREATARETAEKELKKASELPDKWQEFEFDEEAEAARIADDLVANRQFKVDNYRDPAAAKVANDIQNTEKALAKAAKELSVTRSELISAQSVFLTDKTAKRIHETLGANNTTSQRIKTTRAGLRELTSDNYIFGYLGVVVKADGEIMASLGQAEAALAAGDYITLQESAASSRRHLVDSTDWLQAGKQELINVGIYSNDAAELVRFISQATDTTQAFEQAAMFLFGVRADQMAFKQAAKRASDQMNALRKTAETQRFDRDYKTWFLATANRRL